MHVFFAPKVHRMPVIPMHCEKGMTTISTGMILLHAVA
jgi:hypothetical protein